MDRPAGQVLVRQRSADDEAFLRQVKWSDRARTGTGAGRWLARAVTALPMLRRRVAMLLLVVVAGSGLAFAGGPAQADILDAFDINTWCDRKVFQPERADEGMVGMVLEQEWKNRPDKPTTKWGQYGVAGTTWSTFWLDCFSKAGFYNDAANFVFHDTKHLAAMSILIFSWTFRGDLLDVFLSPNGEVGGTKATLDMMIQQIHIDVFLQLFAVGVLIGAIVLAWKWLFSREGASNILGKFMAMVLVAGFAFFYGGAPGGGGPHASSMLKTVNDWTNDITSVVLSAFTGTNCSEPDFSGTGSDFTEDQKALRKRRSIALDCAAESLYEVTIFTPYVVGMLGSYNRANRQENGQPGTPTNDDQMALRMLKHNAYSFRDVQDNGGNIADYRDQRRNNDGTMKGGKPQICEDTEQGRWWTEHRNDAGVTPRTFTMKACDRSLMRENELGVPDEQFDEATWVYSRVQVSENAKDTKYWKNWSGGASDNRFGIAVLALVGSTSIAIIIIVVSLAYLMLQIATIMLALMAPAAFLIGLIPGFGTQILLRWLELLLGTFVKRIVLGLFVGLLMALYSVVLTINMPWIMKLVLVCMIAAIGFTYRKRFTEAFALKFSGSQDFHTDGEMAGKASQLLGGITTGAIGGAVGAKHAGISPWKGALTGAGRGMTPGKTRQAYDEVFMNRHMRRSVVSESEQKRKEEERTQQQQRQHQRETKQDTRQEQQVSEQKRHTKQLDEVIAAVERLNATQQQQQQRQRRQYDPRNNNRNRNRP
ncbi:hypothetical protein Val02_87900 [Virgisporangium aliadipatigenens]|uniref:TrbL/VirB6 plasmid conjugal transfer protein n=1 Tax=Virgisporangium aliadipatigenens TaxID=741659 RepID=A0A8J3YU23_9ACTN|nr:hypothetical protein [Virgisporangium aliadipatigenens]GIJ51904.1 hypothetical protein Val02_87900 [Virgisporangium aliadipatigenens]